MTTTSSVEAPTARTAAQAVAPATNRAPAASQETAAGRGVKFSAAYGHQLRLARAVIGIADHLVAGVPVVDAFTGLLDDAGEVAALP